MPNAAIYARISRDRVGAGLAVDRQLADCRDLCARNGWDVTHVLTDNDISAYSGKLRPGYQSLLELMREGSIDVVVAWHTDRLHRRNSELEGYINASSNVSTHTVKAGQLDLATPAGRAIARTLGAWASYEVETTRDRVKSAKQQAAVSGKFGGGARWYGYAPDPDGIWRGPNRIDETEAKVLHEIRTRYVQGERFLHIAIDLNQRGIPTVQGSKWRAENMLRLLTRKRYAGIRCHNGTEYTAAWPAIFTAAEFAELEAARLHEDRVKSWPIAPTGYRTYLLTGFLYCHCGNKMVGNMRSRGAKRYKCRGIDRTGEKIGCNNCYRAAEPLELFIEQSVLFRLDTPDLAKLLQDGNENRGSVDLLVMEVNEKQRRVDDLVDDYANGLLTRAQLARAKTTAETALEASQARLQAELGKHTSLHINVNERLSDAWQTRGQDWQRQLLGLVIERIIVKPTSPHMKNSDRYMGKWRFRPGDIHIVWKDVGEKTTPMKVADESVLVEEAALLR